MAKVGDRIRKANYMGKRTMQKATDLDADRIRFNWGFHDGVHEERARLEGNPDPISRIARCGADWMDTHHDPVYIEGYKAGCETVKKQLPPNSSERAWQESGRAVNGDDEVSPFRN